MLRVIGRTEALGLFHLGKLIDGLSEELRVNLSDRSEPGRRVRPAGGRL